LKFCRKAVQSTNPPPLYHPPGGEAAARGRVRWKTPTFHLEGGVGGFADLLYPPPVREELLDLSPLPSLLYQGKLLKKVILFFRDD